MVNSTLIMGQKSTIPVAQEWWLRRGPAGLNLVSENIDLLGVGHTDLLHLLKGNEKCLLLETQ
jgi:hypothetical protein